MSRTAAALTGAFLIAAIAFNDAFTSPQLSLWPLYIGPVVLVSWRCGFLEGAVSAAAAGALIMLASIFSGHPYSNNYFFLFATLSEMAALLTIAWFAARLSTVESLLEKLLLKLLHAK